MWRPFWISSPCFPNTNLRCLPSKIVIALLLWEFWCITRHRSTIFSHRITQWRNIYFNMAVILNFKSLLPKHISKISTIDYRIRLNFLKILMYRTTLQDKISHLLFFYDISQPTTWCELRLVFLIRWWWLLVTIGRMVESISFLTLG